MKNKITIEEKKSRLERGERLVATVEALAPGGEGITHEPGMAVFVGRAAPGDRIELELFDVRKDFARGAIVEILERSPQRVEPPCKLFKVCGGCQWQHLDYSWQIKNKEDIGRQTVQRIGGLDPDLVKPTIGAAKPLFYRNKVQFPVGSPRGSDRILAGYYMQDTHELVNIKHCPVQPEPLDRMLAAVKAVCEKHRLTAYDEKSRTGLLRHIIARHSVASNEILVTLVVNARASGGPVDGTGVSGSGPLDLSEMQKLARSLMQQVSEIAGVCLNFNPHGGNKIIGDQTVVLAGQPYIVEELKTSRKDLPERLQQGIQFKLSPTSFFQVNTAQTCTLLEEVAACVLAPSGCASDVVPLIVDAYAGVGAIALWLSPLAARVIAVEEYPAAVADGLLNLELNQIGNVEFRSGRVEEVLPQLADEQVVVHVLVLDPPRKGLSLEALESALALRPLRIVYVSCNPATLARDLRIFDKNGYKTKQIQPVDMFPQTYHIETVTLLEQQKD